LRLIRSCHGHENIAICTTEKGTIYSFSHTVPIHSNCKLIKHVCEILFTHSVKYLSNNFMHFFQFAFINRCLLCCCSSFCSPSSGGFPLSSGRFNFFLDFRFLRITLLAHLSFTFFILLAFFVTVIAFNSFIGIALTLLLF
jgi:hypothetical protein